MLTRLVHKMDELIVLLIVLFLEFLPDFTTLSWLYVFSLMLTDVCLWKPRGWSLSLISHPSKLTALLLLWHFVHLFKMFLHNICPGFFLHLLLQTKCSFVTWLRAVFSYASRWLVVHAEAGAVKSYLKETFVHVIDGKTLFGQLSKYICA